MNANAFRHFYNYHLLKIANYGKNISTLLSQEQFTQNVAYAHGSVRNQIVHLINVDDTWFSGLRGVDIPEWLNPADFEDRKIIRAHWDSVEQNMRDYLAGLRDDMLFEKPFAEGEDKDLILWQVLLHVSNHGTDHRAQLLRTLNDLGLKHPLKITFFTSTITNSIFLPMIKFVVTKPVPLLILAIFFLKNQLRL